MKIHEHLTSLVRKRQLRLPVNRWEELSGVHRRLQLAQRKGWRRASSVLLTNLEYQLRYLVTDIEVCRQSLPPWRLLDTIAPASAIANDLAALTSEFEAVKIDLKRKQIAVQTASIALEGVELGAFDLVLSWESIGDSTFAYSVIAQNPNSAESNSRVTHPHVSEGALCEGEGSVAIQAALLSGRLFDFFLLVRQILLTYNSGSAFVSLDEWSGGGSCEDCGCRIGVHDDYRCERCFATSCRDCVSSCLGCDSHLCSQCLLACQACEETYCSSCLIKQTGTGQHLCPSCLEQGEKDAGEEDETAEATGVAATNTVCMGKTASTA